MQQVKKTAKIEYPCYYHEYTKSRRLEIIQQLSLETGIPVEDIELEPKYIQKSDGSDKLSKEIAASLLDTNKLKENYEKYLIEHYDADKALISLFNEVDVEVLTQMSEDKTSAEDRKYEVLWIEGKNIFSYGAFKRDFRDSSLNLICSPTDKPNMGGKSSLTRMIPFLIFGDKMKRGHNSLPYRLAFNHYCNEDTAYIRGEIKAKGEFYYLHRELKKKKDGELKHTFTIYKYSESGDEIVNGKRAINISKKDNKATLQVFQDIVGDYDDYVFASHYENHNIEKWIATKPTERYRLLCQYLGLGILDVKNQISAKMLSQHQKQSFVGKYSLEDVGSKIESSQTSVENLLSESSDVKNRIDDLRFSNENFDSKRKVLLGKKTSEDKRFIGKNVDWYSRLKSEKLDDCLKISLKTMSLDDELTELTSKINAAHLTHPHELNKMIAELRNKKGERFVSGEINNLNSEIAEIRVQLDNIQIPAHIMRGLENMENVLQNVRQEYSNIKAQATALESEIKELPAKIVCKNCGVEEDTAPRKMKMQDNLFMLKQKMSELELDGKRHAESLNNEKKVLEQFKSDERKKMNAKIEEKQVKIQSIQKEYEMNIQSQIDRYQDLYNCVVQVSAKEQTISALRVQHENAQRELQQIIDEASEFENYMSNRKDTSEIDAQISSLEDLIQKNNSQMNELNIRSNEISKEIGSLEKDIEIHKNILIQLEKDIQRERILKIYTDVHGKDGLNKHIILSVLPQINEDLAILMSEAADFKLEIQFDDEKIEFIIERDGIQKDISSGSGFESTVSCLALHQVNVKRTNIPTPNILVLDEVMGRIGRKNIDGVMRMITKLKEVFSIVDIITHEHIDVIETYCDTKLLVDKVNNISHFTTI